MQVHRCRFIDWVPDEVESLAFSPDGTRLAVGRKVGTIEIYEHVGARWFRVHEVSGESEGSAHTLCWAGAGRLLSGGLGGALSEWSVSGSAALALVQAVPSNGGAVWCVSASPDHRSLAAACEDGAVRLYDLEGTDGAPCLELRATLARRKERLLSVCWSPDGRAVYAGGASGVIAGWDVASGRSVLSASLDPLSGGSTVVWAVACAGPDVLVTGDSLGKTQFWDRATGTRVAAFKEHQSEVLAVAADPTGAAVFSSGVDNKLCMFQRAGARWVCRGGIRRHTHDVRALAISGPYVASAGVDTQVALFTLDTFVAGKVDSLISPFPAAHSGVVSLAPDARLLLARFRRSLQLWRLGSPAAASPPHISSGSGGSEEVVPLKEGHTHLFDFDLSRGTASTLTCSAISRRGNYIACSDRRSLRVYALALHDGGARVDIARVRSASAKMRNKKKSAADVLPGAYALTFTPDESHIITAALDSPEVCAYAITPEGLSLVKRFHWRSSSNSDNNNNNNDNNNDNDCDDDDEGTHAVCFALCVSEDSGLLAAAYTNNYVRVFSMASGETVGTVPPLAGRFTAMAFTHDGAGLVLTTTDARYYVWDTRTAALTDFARTLNSATNRVLPQNDFPIGIAVNPADSDHAFIYANTWMAKLPLSAAAYGIRLNSSSSSSGSNGDEEAGNTLVDQIVKRVTFVKRYHITMFAGFVGSDELVVVERPWVHILQKLPEPFNYSRFAT